MSVASYWSTPKLRPAHWYKAPLQNAAASLFTTVLNSQVFIPVVIGNRVRVDALGLEVTTAQAAASVARLGIYKNTGAEDPRPGNLIVEATSTVNTNSATAQSLAISTVVNGVTNAYAELNQGLYWFSVVVQTAAGTAVVRGDAVPSHNVILPLGTYATAITSLVTIVNSGFYTQASISGALADVTASNLVVGTGATLPRIFFRVL